MVFGRGVRRRRSLVSGLYNELNKNQTAARYSVIIMCVGTTALYPLDPILLVHPSTSNRDSRKRREKQDGLLLKLSLHKKVQIKPSTPTKSPGWSIARSEAFLVFED